MSTASRVGSAMAAGYVLGRFKKLRLALMVGAAMANEDVRNQTATLLMRGPAGLAAPVAAKAGKNLSSQLMEAGKTAAVSAAGSRIGALTDRLSDKTNALQGNDGSPPDEDEEEPDDGYTEEDEAEYDDEAEEDEEEPEDEYEDEPEEEQEEEPEDEYDEEPAEEPVPKQRSPRRRRSAAPAGR